MKPSRFETIVQELPDSQDRIAISIAVFMAHENKEEFTRRAGTFGWQALERLLAKPAE